MSANMYTSWPFKACGTFRSHFLNIASTQFLLHSIARPDPVSQGSITNLSTSTNAT